MILQDMAKTMFNELAGLDAGSPGMGRYRYYGILSKVAMLLLTIVLLLIQTIRVDWDNTFKMKIFSHPRIICGAPVIAPKVADDGLITYVYLYYPM
jgi:hypothetical protein